MRVIVCGGRDYPDDAHVWRTLDALDDEHGIRALAHGGATGADDHAGRWAEISRIEHRVFRADWKKHGKAAGPRRNQKMLDEFKPDVVVAFPGGRGTADMVRRAIDSGVRVING